MQRWNERGDGPGHPRQWVVQRVKLQKVHLSKSCNWTRGAKFSVNVSSAQQFLIAHTYKLCHTEFICIKYKRWTNVRALYVFGRECATAFLHPWTRRFLLAIAWIWWELAWGSMQTHVKWPKREMKHSHRYLHLFLLNKASLITC